MKREIFNRYVEAIAKNFNIDEDNLFTVEIDYNVAKPRQMLYYLCMKRNMTSTEVAKYMRDNGANTCHSSVLRGRDRMTSIIENDRDYYLLEKRIAKCID